MRIVEVDSWGYGGEQKFCSRERRVLTFWPKRQLLKSWQRIWFQSAHAPKTWWKIMDCFFGRAIFIAKSYSGWRRKSSYNCILIQLASYRRNICWSWMRKPSGGQNLTQKSLYLVKMKINFKEESLRWRTSLSLESNWLV